MSKDDLLKNLPNNLKEKYDELFDELQLEKEDLIKKEVNINHKHLDVVNLCASLFSPFSELNLETSFQLLLYEPLYKTGIKNFDVAIYNIDSKQLILVECKSSITYLKNVSDEIKKSIEETNKNLDKLEEIIGDEIKDIEYVYCVPAIDAIDLGKYVKNNELPICIWCYDGFKGIIKLYIQIDETSLEGIENGHLHKNHKLTRLLSKGVESKKTARSFPFLPSSHIYSILMHVCISLVRKMVKEQDWKGEFDFSDVFHIIKLNMANPNTLNDEHIRELSVRVIEKGIDKEVYYDSTPTIQSCESKLYRIDPKGSRISRTEKFVDNNFVKLNSKRMAESDIVEKFKKETGYKDLTDFL
jgi:hypothetical protein